MEWVFFITVLGECDKAFTYYRQHTLTLSYGAAAAEEAYDHDDDAHDDEDVGPHIEEVERLGALHILLEVRVHSHPDTNTKNSAAQQLERKRSGN